VIREHALESSAISQQVVPQVEPSREELLFGELAGAFRMEWNQRFAIDIGGGWLRDCSCSCELPIVYQRQFPMRMNGAQ
jgi:hypothetical protein